MKNLYIILVFIPFFLNAQYLNKSNLNIYKDEIFNFFLKENEFSGDETKEEMLNMVYVRNIYSDNGCISFYEIGTTSAHTLKYLLILENKKIAIYSNKNFNFSLIANFFKNLPQNNIINYGSVFKVLNEVAIIEEYNNRMKRDKIITQ